jgi:hypothetical protein
MTFYIGIETSAQIENCSFSIRANLGKVSLTMTPGETFLPAIRVIALVPPGLNASVDHTAVSSLIALRDACSSVWNVSALGSLPSATPLI